MRRAGSLKRSRRLCLLCAVLLMLALALLDLSTLSSAQTQRRPRRVSPNQPAATPAPSPPAQPANDETPAQAIDPDELITVSTSEVLLPVTVRDAEGRLVTSLTRENFRVYEDGVEQPLSDLALRRVPVDVALLVDTSSSVAAYLEDFRRALDEFAARLAPDDRISLIKFDDRVEVLQDWTTSRTQLRRSLRRLTGGMFTRFNDALYLVAREQFSGGQRRHAIIVFSDGIDNGRGRTSLEAALRSLLEAQATVYSISSTQIQRANKRAELDTLLAGSQSEVKFNQLRIEGLQLGLLALDASEQNLAQLTAATGGRLYKPDQFSALDAVYREVAEELRHQYALYYTPLNKTKDGRFRRVQVAMNGPTLKAATRIGYFAPRK
ncbi:MAG: VWA domain-containing protein [Pyrinomonadaceae bacterium]